MESFIWISYDFFMDNSCFHEMMDNPFLTHEINMNFIWMFHMLEWGKYVIWNSHEIHMNTPVSWKFHQNLDISYEFHMKFMNCVCWDGILEAMGCTLHPRKTVLTCTTPWPCCKLRASSLIQHKFRLWGVYTYF